MTASTFCGLQRALWMLLASLAAAVSTTGAITETPVSTPATGSVVIPFGYRRGHVTIPVAVFGTNRQSFILDTGFSMTMLPPGLGETLMLRPAGHVTIVGIAGEEEASVFDGPRMDFGALSWTSRRVAAFPSTAGSRGRHGEGILGSGFFRRFVVVIDSHAKTLVLHEPLSFQHLGTGEILPLRFKRGSNTPIVAGLLRASKDSEIPGEFEVDTGCDSSLCLGSDFSVKNHLISEDSRSSSRSGVGGRTRTRAGRLEALQLGRILIDHPSAEFFLEGSPAGNGMAGHIGLEAFRNFTVIFDYSRQRLILEERTVNRP
ncbi:MAG: hypothetical protein QOF48_3422 [Verrucomicrobiota bacterium]|jgi:hypothetical protein